METQVRTPQNIFTHPQRLSVPLFQRPYVWSRAHQWEPLWDDVRRLAERLLSDPGRAPQAHFLGAVVLQQIPRPTGVLQERTVIDGQQRLTTLQLLISALHAEFLAANAQTPAKRLEALFINNEAFCSRHEDRHKIWPTNRDREAFHQIMSAPQPVNYEALSERNARLVQAHRFFAEQAREWLHRPGSDEMPRRIEAVERVVRELLQLVVIDLSSDENAQEIFETLNARGSQLTAADLIKNFIFQRLVEEEVDVEPVYDECWKDFETAFWEAEISAGRMRQSRASVFLNHWLIARTGEEIVAREVFSRFKNYVTDRDASMSQLVRELHRAASVYRSFVEDSQKLSGPASRTALFSYRVGILESEVMKPLVLFLLDPEEAAIPKEQLFKAFDVIESWLVRRMLVRATTKSYTQVVAELITMLQGGAREKAGDRLEKHLSTQSSASRYWPDDEEVERSLAELPAYRRLGRGRLRMVLEAIEDHLRGWKGSATALGGERVARGSLVIEHILPRKWGANWPLTPGWDAAQRDRLLHNLGNLTLLTERLNIRLSNGPWAPAKGQGKRQALQSFDVFMLNRELLQSAGESWSEGEIQERCRQLTRYITDIWKVPEGHRSGFSTEPQADSREINLVDLVSAGFVNPGDTLYCKGRFKHRSATVLPDGRIDVEGNIFDSLSAAATAISGRSRNGWSFFLVDREEKRTLKDARAEYKEGIALAADDEDDDEEDDAA